MILDHYFDVDTFGNKFFNWNKDYNWFIIYICTRTAYPNRPPFLTPKCAKTQKTATVSFFFFPKWTGNK